MNNTRTVAVGLVALGLTGCTTVPLTKADMANFAQDKYECHRERREGGFAFGSPAFMFGYGIRKQNDERRNYVLCMNARGYRQNGQPY